jgi:hypothetical protein
MATPGVPCICSQSFDTAFGLGSAKSVLADTVTFFFRVNGQPSDINHDGFMDPAFAETYYNDDFAWAITPTSQAFDVLTVALHESGHALAATRQR